MFGSILPPQSKKTAFNHRFRNLILGLQHTLAMFGSTVLVPFLTGLNVSVTLLCVGIGTLIFHFISKFKVPVFLGSSFAFIGSISFILKQQGISYVKGGIIVSGILYILIAYLVYLFGKDKLTKILPPIVTGPIIMAIGLRLSPVAVKMSGYHNGSIVLSDLVLSLTVITVVLLVMFVSKSFFRYTPIVFAIMVGYILAVLMHKTSLDKVLMAPWFFTGDTNFKDIFVLPKFSLSAIIAIAPIALVTTIEHIGDIKTNGEVVGKDFFADPGLHRTLMGDGFASLVSGFLGGPAVTTYGENTGVLAITKIYNPALLRIAAVFAIVISLSGKISALITNIPIPVMGGISVILFGMIAVIGLRTLISAKLDFNHSRNLIIPACILVSGIGIDSIDAGFVQISGLFVATILGVFLNLILPKNT